MTWIFLGLLVPLAVGLVVMLDGEKEEMSQKRGVTTTQAATQATTRAVTQERGHVAEVLAVGDGRTMWVVHPTVMKTIGGGKILPGYELFATTNGGATWGAIRNKDGLGFFSDYATALALVGRPKGGGSKGSTSACVFSGHNGTVRAVNLSGEVQLMRPLPRGEVLLAAMGSQDGVFALTLGEWGSGREGEGERRREVRLYGLQGEWKMLAEMQGEKGEMPGPGAKVGMAPCGRRVIAMWVEADRLRRGEELVTRGLDYHVKGAAWSKAVRTELAEVGGGGGGGESRLMPVMLDETLYLFWAEKAEYVELHGGWMVTNGGALDLTIPHQNMLPPMKLDGMKQLGVRDVAVGAVENSIGVMASNANGEMITYVFDSLGRKVRGPEAMKVVDSRRDVEFSQSVKIVLLALMLGLSLWRWPKRQQEEERGGGRGVGGRGKLEGGFGAVVLPEGMVTASVPRRGAAFVIDILATWIMMSIASMLMAYGGWTLRPIADWTPLIFSFDELLRLPELMAFWGLYLLHVTAGELVFQRSVGKACVGGGGIRVMMTDGKAPTPGAIVVRNLIRLPEMLLGIFVVYLLFSRGRQRLGDMVARTVVVGERSQK